MMQVKVFGYAPRAVPQYNIYINLYEDCLSMGDMAGGRASDALSKALERSDLLLKDHHDLQPAVDDLKYD